MASCGPRVLTVSKDEVGIGGGGGGFRTIQEAIDAVPMGNRQRTVIRVGPGVYRQPLYIPKTKNFITLAASSPENTILTWDNTATRINHHQPSRLIGTGTFGCGSTIVEGEDFIAENITFENSAPQEKMTLISASVNLDTPSTNLTASKAQEERSTKAKLELLMPIDFNRIT
ncbi:Pectinesterase 31 [Asimina triloba]